MKELYQANTMYKKADRTTSSANMDSKTTGITGDKEEGCIIIREQLIKKW